jgi:hypothetical protein
MNITQILLGLILILGFVITSFVWPYIKMHTTSAQLAVLGGIA